MESYKTGECVKYKVWCEHACHSGYETHSGQIVEISGNCVSVQSGGREYKIPLASILERA
jgi:ribosome maturation factor RimP